MTTGLTGTLDLPKDRVGVSELVEALANRPLKGLAFLCNFPVVLDFLVALTVFLLKVEVTTMHKTSNKISF